jgi:hypothetical protein
LCAGRRGYCQDCCRRCHSYLHRCPGSCPGRSLVRAPSSSLHSPAGPLLRSSLAPPRSGAQASHTDRPARPLRGRPSRSFNHPVSGEEFPPQVLAWRRGRRRPKAAGCEQAQFGRSQDRAFVEHLPDTLRPQSRPCGRHVRGGGQVASGHTHPNLYAFSFSNRRCRNSGQDTIHIEARPWDRFSLPGVLVCKNQPVNTSSSSARLQSE